MPVPESLLLYERDDDGVPFAIEEVRAARWDPCFAIPPDAASADVRVVHLTRGPLPSTIPAWLSVHLDARRDSAPTGIAEVEASYVTASDPTATPSSAPSSAHRHLWPGSPHHRSPSAALDEFVRAGATALRYPEPPPVEPERQAEALRSFARGHEAFAR